MRTTAFLAALALAGLAIACRDNDAPEPDAGGYYGGVRDTTEALQQDRARIHSSPIGEETSLAPRFRAEAGAYRAFASSLEALQPPAAAAAAHDRFLSSAIAIADGLDNLAGLVEQDPQGAAAIQAQSEIEEQLGELAGTWFAACEEIETLAAGGSFPCEPYLVGAAAR